MSTAIPMMTLTQAARSLDVSFWKVHHLWRVGRLAGQRVGKYVFVSLPDVEAALTAA